MNQPAPLDCHIRFNGSCITLEVDGDELLLELSNPELVDPRSGVFAAWAFLPIAMVKNRPLRIHAGGDEVARRNFENLTRTWAAWMPDRFFPATVAFEQEYSTPKATEDRQLLLFSGGVDSTYNLLLRHETGRKQTLLTIHGIDYRHADTDRFTELVTKTDPLARLTGSDRIFLRTTAYDLYKKYGIGVEVGHAFVLSSSLFLYSPPFSGGEISADYARFQEFIVYPWGTNGYTNPFFASASFAMNTANLDLTRSQKLGLISRYPEALSSLSLCKNYQFRPHNCGVCTKCLTIKAMFLAQLGEIPDIFADRAFTAELLETVPFRRRGDRAFLVDIVENARANGFLERIPGIEAKIEQLRVPPSDRIDSTTPKPKPAKTKRKRAWYDRLLGLGRR